jgi:hypothetical protein
MFAQPSGPGTIPSDQFQLPPIDPAISRIAASPSKPGMFGGGKFGLKEALAFGLAGLVSRHNPMLLQGLMGAAMQKRQQAMQEQQYGQRREDDFQDYVRKEAWKQEHAQPQVPDIQERINVLNGITPGLGETYARNYAASGGSPFGPMFTDPASGQRYMMGPQQGLPPIGSVVADPRKQGGPMPSASGGFPPGGY